MGYYINELPNGTRLPAKNKAAVLLSNGAQLTDPTFKDNLVCVVENFLFDAAGYAYSEEEFEDMLRDDGRNKTWLIVPDAAKLSGFTK